MSSSRLELRAPSVDDLPALTAFFDAMRAAGDPRALSEGQVRDSLTSRLANAAENFRIGLDNGRVGGWISVWYPGTGSERIFLEPKAYPRELDVYRQLLDWGEARARAIALGSPARIHAGGPDDDETLNGELRERGYELVRHFFTMEIDLAEEPAKPDWPDGIGVRTFRSGDERAVYEADMEAFEDHWDFFTVSFEEWREYFVESDEFDPQLVFLAEDGKELAGFALCWSERRPDTGHVNVLAVRRPWRGRGLGTALLLHSFHEFRRRGRAKVDLGVDAENLTGAVRLYERVGMRAVRRFDAYRKELA
jgi:mycothiol synthase